MPARKPPPRKAPERASKRDKTATKNKTFEGEPEPPRKPRAPPHAVFGSLICEEIVDYMRRGATQAEAADLAGIAPRTLRSWLAQGRHDRAELDRYAAGNWDAGRPPPQPTPHSEFVAAYQAAARSVTVLAREVWVQAIRVGNLEASIKWLQTRHPDEWPRVTQGRAVEVNDEGEVTDAKHDDFAAVIAKIDGQHAAIKAVRDKAGKP